MWMVVLTFMISGVVEFEVQGMVVSAFQSTIIKRAILPNDRILRSLEECEAWVKNNEKTWAASEPISAVCEEMDGEGV